MDDEIAFLQDAAERLDRIANTAPEIASPLRQLADELAATAADLRQNRRRGARADY